MSQELCFLCDGERGVALFKVSVTTLDGTVIDSETFCTTCARYFVGHYLTIPKLEDK